MKVIQAKLMGYCYGVRRAMDLAYQVAGANSGPVYTLGALIHNPQEVQRLAEAGVQVREHPEDLSSGTVIIRAHGLPLGQRQELEARGLEVVDATCPHVQKPQKTVQELSRDGYYVLVVGHEGHPEVLGLTSYARSGRVSVVADAPNLAQIAALQGEHRVGVVAQTTIREELLASVVKDCLRRHKEVRVYNTICDSTRKRQLEAVELAREVDAVVVIGGHNSSNTRRLAEICREIREKTFHIETAEELLAHWFVKVETLGVTAGASTPTWLIEAVVNRLEEMP